MRKKLIYITLCLCAGSITATSAAWAKKESNCTDPDVVLSKKYPNFDASIGCAYDAAGNCDPDNSNIIYDNEIGLVIQGSNKRNVIYGGDGPDLICGGNGKDEIWGNGGDDVIYGGNSKDALYGGLGNDVLYGGKGKDYLSGYDDDNNESIDGSIAGEDDDELYGENGKDELHGGPGDDILSGGKGKDYLDGGDGDDDISGGKGKDICVDTDDDISIEDTYVDECEATVLEDTKKKDKS